MRTSDADLVTTTPPVPRTGWVLGLVACYAVAAVAAVVLVDVVLGGLGDASARGTPVWFVLFEEGSPTEWVQAALLLLWLLYAGIGSALWAARGEREGSRLLLLLGVAASLLVLDDTCNIGQWLGARADEVLGEREGVSPGDVARLPVFAVAAAIPTYCLWRYRALLARLPRARRLLWAGYGLYALMAVVGQALTLVLPIYPKVGNAVLDGLFGGALRPQVVSDAFFADPGTVFMDYVFEESLELAAAALLAVGVLELVRVARGRAVS